MGQGPVCGDGEAARVRGGALGHGTGLEARWDLAAWRRHGQRGAGCPFPSCRSMQRKHTEEARRGAASVEVGKRWRAQEVGDGRVHGGGGEIQWSPAGSSAERRRGPAWELHEGSGNCCYLKKRGRERFREGTGKGEGREGNRGGTRLSCWFWSPAAEPMRPRSA